MIGKFINSLEFIFCFNASLFCFNLFLFLEGGSWCMDTDTDITLDDCKALQSDFREYCNHVEQPYYTHLLLFDSLIEKTIKYYTESGSVNQTDARSMFRLMYNLMGRKCPQKAYPTEGTVFEFKFKKDFARNWLKGEKVPCRVLTNNMVLVDNVASVDLGELLKHGLIVSDGVCQSADK